MSEPKTYLIQSVTDFDKVPLERIADCIIEFSTWIALRRMAKAISNEMDQPNLKEFNWIDDGKKEVVVRMKLPTLEVPNGVA